ISPNPELNLYDPNWPVWTYQVHLPPAKFVFNDEDRRGMAVDSTVSGGCIISGSRLNKTLLFSNVRVHSYSTIDETVILPEVVVHRNCRIRRAIIDRGCEIPADTVIGYDSDQDRKNGFRITSKGIVLVTREMLGQQGGYA
ncbi:MAG TPA: glucose-1-phosphate adenylyltransferase, partial [Pelovirga sp.]|nr:glucose-1-phosphate adenylyltransferase [Pelovirga sp.]